jgi:hypothetical protein
MDAVYTSILEWLKLEWKLPFTDELILLVMLLVLVDIYKAIKAKLTEQAVARLAAGMNIFLVMLPYFFWVTIALNAYLSGHYHLLIHAVIAWVFAKESKWVAAYDRWVDRRLNRQTES